MLSIPCRDARERYHAARQVVIKAKDVLKDALAARTPPRVDPDLDRKKRDARREARLERDRKRKERDRERRDRGRDRDPVRTPRETGGNTAGSGYISVNSRPWGQVWVDGRRAANETPLIRYRVSSGYHTVTVKFPTLGGRKKTKRVFVKPGGDPKIFVSP